MGQTFTRAFPGQFDQAQGSEPVDRDAGAVPCQGFAKLLENGLLVFFQVHVDEIDDDDSPQIAQAQLTGNGMSGFEVGLENGFIEVTVPHEASGIDVDGGHGFGLVDDQVSA
ncbi:hypothetical protein B1A_18321 [mine drainage metagenome]|uniref:Uncharacterized protein n=1 Tax=mine drainage metagenome TaxID=410659 RepID=T0YQG3_9ZZZZ